MMMSDLLPNLAGVTDDLCLMRAMYTDNKAHAPATLQFHTGTLSEVRPSLGSWISYGLGTENENLPSFHDHSSAGGWTYLWIGIFGWGPPGNPRCRARPTRRLCRLNILQDSTVEELIQRRRLDFQQGMNRRLLGRVQADARMEGMIESFELAFRMQTETPQLVDLSDESEETLRLYGVNDETTDRNGRACLLGSSLKRGGSSFCAGDVWWLGPPWGYSHGLAG